MTFKNLVEAAYKYDNKNFESDWGENTVLHALDEVIDYTKQLKTKETK